MYSATETLNSKNGARDDCLLQRFIDVVVVVWAQSEGVGNMAYSQNFQGLAQAPSHCCGRQLVGFKVKECKVVSSLYEYDGRGRPLVREPQELVNKWCCTLREGALRSEDRPQLWHY